MCGKTLDRVQCLSKEEAALSCFFSFIFDCGCGVIFKTKYFQAMPISAFSVKWQQVFPFTGLFGA